MFSALLRDQTGSPQLNMRLVVVANPECHQGVSREMT